MSMGSLAFAFSRNEDVCDVRINCVQDAFVIFSALSSSIASVDQHFGSIGGVVRFKHFCGHVDVLLSGFDIC